MIFNHSHKTKQVHDMNGIFDLLDEAVAQGRLKRVQKLQDLIEERIGKSHLDWKIAYQLNKGENNGS